MHGNCRVKQTQGGGIDNAKYSHDQHIDVYSYIRVFMNLGGEEEKKTQGGRRKVEGADGRVEEGRWDGRYSMMTVPKGDGGGVGAGEKTR